MTATTVLVLVLAGLLGVLLLAHRTDGTLLRAVVEYAIVAVLALLLAFTPATRDASAGVTAGVTSGSASLGRLVADAWQQATGQQATDMPAAAEPTQPTPKATRPPRTTRPAAPPASSPTPAQPSRPAARGGVPAPLGVLLLLGIVLLGLVGLAWRIRRLDQRGAAELDLARLPRGRRRRRIA